MCLVFAKEACEGPNAQEKAEFLMGATGHHLEDVIALFRQRNTSTLCRPWRLVRDRTLQDKAERLMATTCQLFEEMKATYHSLGIAGKAAGKFIRHPVGLQTALVEMWCGTSPRCPQQCILDCPRAVTAIDPTFSPSRSSVGGPCGLYSQSSRCNGLVRFCCIVDPVVHFCSAESVSSWPLFSPSCTCLCDGSSHLVIVLLPQLRCFRMCAGHFLRALARFADLLPRTYILQNSRYFTCSSQKRVSVTSAAMSVFAQRNDTFQRAPALTEPTQSV